MKNPFRHVRFSLTGLFAATLFVACVVATLRYTTRLWADAAFTLALAAIAVAILGTIYRTGATRAFWVGALLGGGGYLMLAYGPWIGESVRPHLVATPLLSAAYEKLQATFNPPTAFPLYPPEMPSSAATVYPPSYPIPSPAYAGPPADSPPGADVPPPEMPNADAGLGTPIPDAPGADMPPPEMPNAEGAPQSGAPAEAAGDSSYFNFIPNAMQPDSANAARFDPLLAPATAPPFAVYQSPTTWVSDLPQWDDLERAGHSLTALLAAFVFGVTARWFDRTRSAGRQTD